MAKPVVADLALAVAVARNDRPGATVAEGGALPVGIVTLVGAQAADPAGRLGQNRRRGRHIAGGAGRQQEDAGPPEDIGKCVDLGGLATARRTDGLRPRPLPALASAVSIAFQKPRRDRRLRQL